MTASTSASNKKPIDRPLCFHEMFIDEFRHVRGLSDEQRTALVKAELLRDDDTFPVDNPPDEQSALRSTYAILTTTDSPLSALCLSGGGIRSASFALGVLQGLASARVLERIDYLSTVSGGGFVGGFLTAWIHRAHQTETGAGVEQAALKPTSASLPDGVQRVFAALAGNYDPKSPTAVEPAPIKHLRSYSRYLAPRSGWLSIDTWTLVAIYVRNLAITWTVILPFFMGLLALPLVFTSGVTASLPSLPLYAGLSAMFLLLLVAAPALALFRSRLYRLGHVVDPTTTDSSAGIRHVVVPALLAASALAVMAIGTDLLVTARDKRLTGATWIEIAALQSENWKFTFAWVTAMFGASAGGIAAIFQEAINMWDEKNWRPSFQKLRFSDLVVMPAAGCVGALVGALLLIVLADMTVGMQTTLALHLFVTLAPAIGLLAVYVGLAAYAALGNRFQGDLEREWLARISAQVLMVAVGWAGLFALALFGPYVVSEYIPGAVEMAGGLSALAVYVLTKLAPSAKDMTRRDPALLKIALQLSGVILLVCVAMLIARLNQIAMPYLVSFLSRVPLSEYYAPLLLVAGTWLVAMGLSVWINPNSFALHATYRLRIVRTWLGATRPDVRTNKDGDRDFAGDDDLSLATLWPQRHRKSKDSPRPLFPVINAALNVVGGGPLGIQDRKALPFTFTPLHCGTHSAGSALGYRPTSDYAYDHGNRTGVTLGTAMAISGAAVSPSMGAFSSGVTALVLALLNIRLGSWLGNPGAHGRSTWKSPGPRFALNTWLSEAFGRARADSRYVYLSDGGHFENLGVYDMIRRRCRRIIVSDAGCDGDRAYADLATLVRLVRVDLGIDIHFAGWGFPSLDQPVPRLSDHPVMVGTIRYASVDGAKSPDGVLMYVKASLTGKEPIDVHNFARRFPDFPHQSTADQFFDEPQLESYRMLGYRTIAEILPPIEEEASGTSKDHLARLVGVVQSLRDGADQQSVESTKQNPNG